MTTPSNESIIHFVRHTLGCNCPDEVFKQIEFKPFPAGKDAPNARIIVGGRLLIHLCELADDVISEATLASLTIRGIEERDSSGLNRFRLVLVSRNPDITLNTAAPAFESISGSDEKAHLHVINIHEPALIPLLM